MNETMTVAADDLRAVAAAMTELTGNFGWMAAMVPGFGDALAALARMTSVPAAPMPEDPVGGIDEMAIRHHEMAAAYERAGFSREEAMAFTVTIVQATVTASALRGGIGT